MRYTEVVINTPAELIDRRCVELEELGVSGFVIENEQDFESFLENNHQYWDYVDNELESRFQGVSRIKLYLEESGEGPAILDRIRAAYPDLTERLVDSGDWENNWRDYYQPIETGNKLIVVPEWLDTPESERMPLRLDPGLIFGTGSHATTKLCLAAMEDYAVPGVRVLDLGCGSGILGIGAVILGADSCLGVDIDPKAPDVAMSNSALNGLNSDTIRFLAGDILADLSLRRALGEGYGLVLANIVADVIIPLSGFVRQFMAEDGVFICSGIIENRWTEVESALRKNGFEIKDHRCDEEWHMFVCS